MENEKSGTISSSSGSRQLNLHRSFKLGLQSLLTSCSKEEFCKAFPSFTSAEQQRLHGLYIKVIASLHQNIEDEFETLCQETQVGNALDTVEELVEEQALDPLFSDKTRFEDIELSLSVVKKNEIHYLTNTLEKAEIEKNELRARVQILKNEIQDASGASIAEMQSGVMKLRNKHL